MSREYADVTEAIRRSVTHNEIARVEWSAQAELDLNARCDNSANLRLQAGYVDYWGTDDEGDEWRVYLVGAPPEGE